MRVRSFIAKRLHGYIDVNITFRDDLTFLTGVNGSGKTSVVRSIVSLISPSIHFLCTTRFSTLAVEVEHEKKTFIRAQQSADVITISTSLLNDQTLTLPSYNVTETESIPSTMVDEFEDDYIRRIKSIALDHPVYKAIQSLPTPMYLGIERRTQTDLAPFDQSLSRFPQRKQRSTMRLRNIFAGSLIESLEESGVLAARTFRRMRDRQENLNDQLRQEIILSNFDFVDVNTSAIPPPNRDQILRALNRKDAITSALEALGLDDEKVKRNVNIYFQKLEELSKLISSGADSAESPALITWVFNHWQFEKITKIISLIERHNEEVFRMYADIDAYKKMVNSFLQDTGKRIDFDNFGIMKVFLKNKDVSDLSSLSSGERQIVVILTHLAFNPAAKDANVLIIDEPELSLHVTWQERFVKALKEANPAIQLILATHSPSILLDDIEHCVDLGGGE